MSIKTRCWMHDHLEEHRDPLTDEINATKLAEDCINTLEQAEFRHDQIYEEAAAIAIGDYRRRHRLFGPAVSGFINSLPSDCF